MNSPASTQTGNKLKMYSIWFLSNVENIEFNENVNGIKITHVSNIKKLLQIENLDEFLNKILSYPLSGLIMYDIINISLRSQIY